MRIVAALAFVVLAGACSWPDTTIGQSCTKSLDCSSERVCLPLDADKPDGAAACLPMPETGGSLATPVACTDVPACVKAGYPVDVDCTSSQCQCNPVLFTCDNSGVDPFTCLCQVAEGGI